MLSQEDLTSVISWEDLIVMRRATLLLSQMPTVNSLTKMENQPTREATWLTKMVTSSITTMVRRCSIRACLMQRVRYQPHSMWKSITLTLIK